MLLANSQAIVAAWVAGGVAFGGVAAGLVVQQYNRWADAHAEQKREQEKEQEKALIRQHTESISETKIALDAWKNILAANVAANTAEIANLKDRLDDVQTRAERCEQEKATMLVEIEDLKEGRRGLITAMNEIRRQMTEQRRAP